MTELSELSELSVAYHKFDAIRIDLDRRITALPTDDIAGRDALLAELETELANLSDTVSQMTAIRARDMAEVRLKAAALVTMRDRQEPDVIGFAFSLADDIVRLPY